MVCSQRNRHFWCGFGRQSLQSALSGATELILGDPMRPATSAAAARNPRLGSGGLRCPCCALMHHVRAHSSEGSFSLAMSVRPAQLGKWRKIESTEQTPEKSDVGWAAKHATKLPTTEASKSGQIWPCPSHGLSRLSNSGPNLVDHKPNWTMSCQSCSRPGQFWSKFASVVPNLVGIGPSLAELGPKLVDFRSSLADSGPSFVDSGRIQVEVDFGPKLAEFEPKYVEAGRNKICRPRPKFGKLGRCWSMLSNNWGTVLNSADVDRLPSHFGLSAQTRPSSGDV